MYISDKPVFGSKIDEAFYNKYRKAAIIAFPYAIKAIRVFRAMEADTKNLSKKERKKYVKKLGNELEDEFEKPLKNLTRTQGRVLVKMIEKELHTPMYQLVKELKGGFSAWRYNFLSGFYDYNLKDGYVRGADRVLDDVLDDFNISYTIDQENKGKLE
jgi:mRNA-degrading endonuclease RelE of RelBE toxin-antitoxin system